MKQKKDHLRSFFFRRNLSPDVKKPVRQDGFFRKYLLDLASGVSPFMIDTSRFDFKYSCTLFGFKMFIGQNDAHQPPTKGSPKGGR